MAASKPASRLAWFAITFLVVIGIAAVTRRTLVLLWPAQFGAGHSNPAAALDTGFARHRALTLVHILPGAMFLGLAGLQLAPGIRRKHLQFHRWSGRFLVGLGLVIGISALIMSYTMNIGGPNEAAATTLFAIIFLICLVKAYLFIRRKDVRRHREWMIRAYAVTLGVATTRPIVGMFFAFRRLTPHEFFGIAFWLGFTITFLAGEAWIDYTRYYPTKLAEAESGSAAYSRELASAISRDT
ncbi:MAG TPA: DUF2306 domain-containing protein [Verrucomicrobiae bacterium]|nr:DUF2306 domain-containing protein [Verrucomicrobiae bacterium]